MLAGYIFGQTETEKDSLSGHCNSNSSEKKFGWITDLQTEKTIENNK